MSDAREKKPGEEAAPKEERRINMYSPDGELMNFPLSQARTAIDAGYRIETPEQAKERVLQGKYGDVTSQLKAGAMGAARGLTMGLSDQFLTGTGIVEQQEARALKEANPITSVSTELGGAILPAFVSRGRHAGQISKLISTLGTPVRGVDAAARAVEQGALNLIGTTSKSGLLKEIVSRGAAKGLGSATAGAFYATGQVISEHALGNPQLTADKMVSHIGMGTLLGAGIGGVLGGAGAVGSAAFNKIVNSASSSGGLGGFAERRAVKGLFATQLPLSKLDRKGRLQEVGRDLLTPQEALGGKKVLDALGSLQKTMDNIQRVKEYAGRQAGDVIRRLDKVFFSAAKQGDTKLLRAPQGAIDPMVIARRIRDEILEPIRGNPALHAEQEAIMTLANHWAQSGKKLSFSVANKFKSQAQKKANWERMNPDYAELLKRRSSAILRDEIEKQAAKIDSKLHQELVEANRLYGSMMEAEKLAQQGLFRQMGNRTFGLTDNIMGAAAGAAGVMGGGAAGLAAGPAAAVGNKILRERANVWIANAADRVARMSAVEKLSNNGTRDIVRIIDNVLGAPKPLKAAEKSASRWAVPTAEKILASWNLGDDATTPLKKSEKIKQLASNPVEMNRRVERAVAHIGDVAPETAQEIANRMHAGVQFLASKAISGRSSRMNASLTPHLVEPRADRQEMRKWARYVQGVNSPADVLKLLDNGKLKKEHVEAIAAVYPRFYELVSAELSRRASELKNELPRHRRIQLSIWFGVPLDQTMTPQFYRMMGIIHAGERAKRKESGEKRKASKKTRKVNPEKMSSNARTESERVESG